MYKKNEYGEVGQKKKLVNVFEQNMIAEKEEQEQKAAANVKPTKPLGSSGAG
jgi:hypothetical protein